MGRRRRGVPRLLALGAVTLSVACGDSFTATIEDRRPFDPPPVYADWWGLTEACSGRAGDLPRIHWYLASSIVADGKLARARWSPPHDIVAVQGNQTEERLIRHEMLHDLLGGDPGHEGEVWDVCDLRF